jgi:hypothetical protein
MLYLLEEDDLDQNTVRGIFATVALAQGAAQDDCPDCPLEWEDDGITWTAGTYGDSVFAVTEWQPDVFNGREDRV